MRSQNHFVLAAILLIVGAIQLDAAEQSKPGISNTPSSINVLCVDQDDKPVVGAVVYLFQNVDADATRYKQFGPFTSDEQGHATCPRAVVYDGQGHFDRWAYARVPGRLVGIARSTNWKNRSPINSEFRIQLYPARSVEGLVTVPDGFDPSQVTVHAQVVDISTGPGDFDSQSLPRYLPFAGLDTALPEIFDKPPDAEGRIRFDDVPVRGRLLLVTSGAGLAEAQWRNENKTFDEPIRLTLIKEGLLTGRVVSPDGKPAVGMKVTARLTFTPQRLLFLSTFRSLTDANGQFTVHGLPPTRFVLSVEDPSHDWAVRPRERLLIPSGETKDVMVSMENCVAVSGRVFDSEDNPVEGASLSALADTEDGPSMAHDRTGRDGGYRLRLPSGRAKLYFDALPPGFAYPEPQIIKRLDITAGQDAIEGLDFTISRKPNDGQAVRQDTTPKAPAVAKEKKPNPALAQQVAEIAEQCADRERKFHDELRAANHDNDKVRDANNRFNDDRRELAKDLMYLVAEHAADAEAFDGVLALVVDMSYPLDDSLTEIVLDQHLADPDIGRLCFALRHRGGEAWAGRILEAVAEKHPQRDVRGQAVFGLGDYHRGEAFPWGRVVPEVKQTPLLAAAIRRYQQTLDEFAETPTPDGKTTLGEKARHELTRLKNLPDLKVGRPAPPIVAEALDGKPMSLADYRGQVVMLVFWGSWCGPCMQMVPHERELAERYRGKPFMLLGVNCGDTRELAKATMEKQQMTWRCWWDGEEIRGPIETDYDVPHWPRVFVIDDDGIIRAIDPEPDDLDSTIEMLLQAKPN